MGPPTFDLQSHSTCSDGALAPADVVAAAADAGVQLLALTDHDTVDGVDEALRGGRGSRPPRGRRRSSSPLSTTTGRTCTSSATCSTTAPRACSRRWPSSVPIGAPAARRMADALRDCGFELEFPERASIGRPHLAHAAFDHPANRMRLAREEIVNASQLLEALSDPRRPRLPAADQADDGRGHRAGPPGRRGRRLGPSVLGSRRAR